MNEAIFFEILDIFSNVNDFELLLRFIEHASLNPIKLDFRRAGNRLYYTLRKCNNETLREKINLVFKEGVMKR